MPLFKARYKPLHLKDGIILSLNHNIGKPSLKGTILPYQGPIWVRYKPYGESTFISNMPLFLVWIIMQEYLKGIILRYDLGQVQTLRAGYFHLKDAIIFSLNHNIKTLWRVLYCYFYPLCCWLLIWPIHNYAKKWKMTETLVNGYPSESTQRELSNEYQHDRCLDVLQQYLHHCALDEINLSIGRVKVWIGSDTTPKGRVLSPQGCHYFNQVTRVHLYFTVSV